MFAPPQLDRGKLPAPKGAGKTCVYFNTDSNKSQQKKRKEMLVKIATKRRKLARLSAQMRKRPVKVA